MGFEPSPNYASASRRRPRKNEVIRGHTGRLERRRTVDCQHKASPACFLERSCVRGATKSDQPVREGMCRVAAESRKQRGYCLFVGAAVVKTTRSGMSAPRVSSRLSRHPLWRGA
jgi:hypothetical protein